ncbi:MAG: TspO/MBR family protein [Bacteroidales bacterium]|nr:TspO/MBR family protein [Bacteroidales bacterium]
MKRFNVIKLIVAIILPVGLGAIAGMFTAQAVPEWYASLNRPSFNPPDWIFGPVWTFLYIVMGFSFYLIWKQEVSKARNRAVFLFFVQLLLNFIWSLIFFYFNMIGLALIEIIVLWLSIIVMIIHFFRINHWAMYINIPYLLWVTFATVLNASYYMLN